MQSGCAKYSYRASAGHVLTTQRALEKVIWHFMDKSVC